MKIEGVEGLTAEDIRNEIDRGGTFVVYTYVISVLVITFTRNSPVIFVKGGESRVMKGLLYTLLSLFLGWWGFPWGLIRTPMALYTNLSGGKDVTNEMVAALRS